MANKTKATKEVKAPKEKRTFTVYEKKGKAFVPTTTILHSTGPTSAAKKAGNYLLKATGAKTAKVYLREAGIHDRVREYDVTLAPHYVLEPTGFSRDPAKGFAKVREFKGDEPEFVKRNIHFATSPIEPSTGKPWSDEAIAARNAEWLPGKVGIKLLPGKHIEISGVSGSAKYIQVHKLPEGTVMSARVADAKPATEKAEKPAKASKKKAAAEVPAPVEEVATEEKKE